MPTHAANGVSGRRARNQRVSETLMIPLVVIVLDELGDGAAEMGLLDRN